ncbi:MAG: MFS transporter, partial [Spirochaetota bacterium]
MKNRIKASPDTTLKVRTAVGYGLGDLYGGGATTLINVYYLIFLTDVLGIPGSLAGLAFLISKLWD